MLLMISFFLIFLFKHIDKFGILFTGKPSQPSVARTLSKGPKEIMIAWIHGHHRKKVLFTRISYAEEKLTPKFKRLDGEENTFSILGLKPFTTYMITVKTCVKSFNDILCSDPSRKLAVTTSIAGIIKYLHDMIF